MRLAQKHCGPVGPDTPRVSDAAARKRMASLPGWTVGRQEIHRDLKFQDFRRALRFVNRVGALAESEGHHPELKIHSWNHVRLALRTDAIGGLSENDFILAARINLLLKPRRRR